jgi:alkylation response protein AidB-like acyl-CoA dehydrogenase
MDSTLTMLRDSVARLLKDRVTPARTVAAESAGIDADLWSAFAELGVRGDGLELGLDAQMAVLQEIGRSAALVPYAESEVLGRWLASAAALTPGDGVIAVLPEAIDATSDAQGAAVLPLKGRMLPWGRHAAHVLVLCRVRDGWRVADIDPSSLQLRHDANMAGEPRDVVMADAVQVSASRLHRVRADVDGDALSRLGALCRTASMLGALGAAHELALQYAQDRKQFGKPISQFQVIQSYLAEMAAEVCAVAVALDLAVEGAISGRGWGDVAVAKVRAGQAARVVTRLAHQIHGAIGMTHEYPLHVWTRRLWAWREEFGNETSWSGELGRSLIETGEDAFWPRLAGESLALTAGAAR